MLNNFVNFKFFFTKLSGIDPCEKRINRLGVHAWRNFFIACSKHEAMAIYVVKQASQYGGLSLRCHRVTVYRILSNAH